MKILYKSLLASVVLVSACGGGGGGGGADSAPPPAPSPPPPVPAGRTVSTADQPDEVAGYQVHVMYVVASDGVDRSYDLNGEIAGTVGRWNAWLAQETGGRQIRLDTVGGDLDISFVRLERTDAQMNAYVDMRRQLENELVGKGFDDPEKLYLVYYDGGSSASVACGMGAGPPLLPGTMSTMFLTAEPNGFDCRTVFFGETVNVVYRDYIGIHELLHSLGFIVADCAPGQGDGWHVVDDEFDVMYVGPNKSVPPRLDAGNDDYFEHGIPGCLDLANSAFLEPLPAAAEPPPGWPYTNLTEISCSTEATMRSTQGADTRIHFINAMDSNIYVYWLDTSGTRQFMSSVAPNNGYVQQAALTYPYVVTDTSNQCLAIFSGEGSFSRAIVK